MNINKLLSIAISLIFFLNNTSFSEDIPIIVIAPGKTMQSKSTVGSSVSVIQNEQIEGSPEFFLADILKKNLTGMNHFRNGGYGTTSAIQLRGLPKRYSTIYIDGVKMSDPSTPTNSFDLTSIMKNGIDRVEILRGSQSSLYGSHAIGGTINIFTKKGNGKNDKNLEITNGTEGTKNLAFSYGGSKNKHSYFISLNKFITDGISAMNDNNESDSFENKGLISNYAYQLGNNFKIENNLRYNDSLLNYDSVNSSNTDLNTNTDDQQISNSLKLTHKTENGENIFSYNKLYSERYTTNYNNAKKRYIGHRDALNFLGVYNFNLDTKIIFGLDNEFDASNYLNDNGIKLKADEAIYSQYIDLQFRPLEKLFSTIGFRRDLHTTSEEAYTGRASIAYKLDKKSKIRSSFGTGVRYPALYEYFYGTVYNNKEDIAPELSKSFDIGYETNFEKYNIDFDITAFNITYDDAIEGWEGNNDGGSLQWGYGLTNTDAKIESKGIELSTLWKPKNDFKIGFNYNYSDTFDGADCNDPNKGSNCIDPAMVRVPRHSMTTYLNYLTKSKIKNLLSIKHNSETRDYGNVNNSWKDLILGSYTTVDYQSSYKIYDTLNLYISIENLFDESYEQAWQYSSMGRSLNFGIKRVY